MIEPRSYRPRDRAALAEQSEDDLDALEQLKVAPLKARHTRSQDAEPRRPSQPSKISRAELADSPTPAHSLAYTQWMLAPERGWSGARVDRRGDAPVDDGALATAFSFLSPRSGAPLPAALARRLGQELGVDLSRVRIHTDDAAHQAATALAARAFTIGEDIYFERGAYDPESASGVELIAHEVTHVAQNLLGQVPTGTEPRVSRPDEAHEREAEKFAARFAAAPRPEPTGAAERGAEVQAKFSGLFEHVGAHTGQAAKLARELLSAGALVLRDLVSLAEESPRRQTLLQELAHLIPSGAGSVGPSIGLTVGPSVAQAPAVASSSVVHRDPQPAGSQQAPAWNKQDAAKRVQQYVDDTSLVPRRDTGSEERVFAHLDDETKFFDETSAKRWQREDYVSGIKGKLSAPIPSDTDLQKDLAAVHAAGLVKGLVQVGGDAGKSWGWISPKENPPTNVKFVGTLEYEHKSVSEKYDGYVNTLHETKYLKPPKPKLVAKFNNNAELKFTKTGKTKPATEGDLSKCRQAIRDAANDVEEYKLSKNNGWDTFFEDVIEGPSVKFPAGFQGDLFAMIAARDLGTQVSRQEVRFDDDRLSLNADDRRADGVIFGKQLKLTEFKGYSSTPDLGEGSKLEEQARNYARILKHQITAKKIDPPSRKGPFTQVAYVFPTKEMSKAWAPKLKTIFEAEGQGKNLRVFPAAEGSGVATLKVNPTFEIPLPEGTSQTHQIAAPQIQHPGVLFSNANLRMKPGSTEIESGSIDMEVGLGEAVTGKKATKRITAGAIENKFDGLTTSLSKIFKSGRISADAKLTDDGVEATVTVSAGPSGIPKLNLQQSAVTVTFKTDGSLQVKGQLGLASQDGKIHGTIDLGWNGADWTFKGSATVEPGVIKGIEGFTASVSYEGGVWTLGIDSLTITQKIKAVTLTGKAMGVRYDMQKGNFSGLVTLDADLGLFGRASGEITLEDNKLTKGTLSYDTPELKYPAKSEKPAFKGTVGGTITYDNGEISGAIRGTAGLNIPALEKIAGEGGLGLTLDGQIHPDGHFSGTIASTSALKLGKYLEIPSISCSIKDNGDVEGNFKLKVVNFKYLDKAEIACKVDKNGVSISEAAIAASFGAEGDKFRGSLSVAYKQAEGLTITGSLTVKIKEGLVATGTLTYSSKDEKVQVELKVDEITLLKHGPVTKSLFKFAKQIPLVSVYGLGIYLDLGFNLDFNYEFDLRLAPKVTLTDLSLETFEYKEVKAEIELLGQLAARLVATPKVGLGLFALSPSLLRGGGGVMIPITGEALLKPKGKLSVAYSPTGGASGDVELGMALTFGIKGAVKPYAELSLLDGVWNPSWTGESLADFEIMPPKELFNFQLDLNGDMKKQEPKIPEAPGAPKAGSGKQLAQEPAKPSQSGTATADRNAQVPSSGPSGSGGGLPDEPVKLSSMTSGLKGLPGYQTIESIMKKAGAAWDKIKGFFGRVAKAFKSFFEGLADAMEEIIDGFAKEGLAYLPKLIKKIVGPTTWEIIEPLIDAVASNADKILELFETDPPKGTADFFPWALKVVAKAWGLAFDSIGSLVSALRTMISRLGNMAGKIVTKMVADGMIGVKRHRYWYWFFGKHYFLAATQYKIHLLGVNIDFYDQGNITDPRSVVGFALFEVLEQMNIPYSGHVDDKTNEHTRDRWA